MTRASDRSRRHLTFDMILVVTLSFVVYRSVRLGLENEVDVVVAAAV